MKTITSLLVIAVFIYIVYKRRISPVLPKNKNKKAKTSGTGTQNKDTAIQTIQQSVIPCQPSGIPSYGFTLDTDIHYDLMLYDFLDEDGNPDICLYADRINAKLNLIASDMIRKGYPYRIDFMTVGSVLLILVTYRIKPNAIPSDIPSEDAS